MKHKISVLAFMLLISLYSHFTLFGFTPLCSNIMNRGAMIGCVSFLLLCAHLAYCLVMRREHPLIWMINWPLDFLFICLISCINRPYFIESLEIYGIYSIYSAETDAVLTAVPFYIDAIFFASLLLSCRIALFIPFYYWAKANASKTKSKTVSSL